MNLVFIFFELSGKKWTKTICGHQSPREGTSRFAIFFLSFVFLFNKDPRGLMVRRMTSNHEIAGSSPVEDVFFLFFFVLSFELVHFSFVKFLDINL